MKKQLLFLLLAATAFVVGCQREETILDVDYKGGNPVVDFAGNTDGYIKYELALRDEFQPIEVSVKLANTTEGAPEDILVYLSKVDALVSTYNSEHGTNLAAVSNTDAGLRYDFSKPVVIKKGQKRALINMEVNPAKLNLAQLNAIGIAVARVEGPASVSNSIYSKVVIEFGARNAYDGVYSVVSGRVTRYTAPGAPANDALSGDVTGNPDLVLVSVDATTVEIQNLRWAGGSSGVAGIDNLRATVNPSTNQVTMRSLGNATLANWTGSTSGITYNRYDPATRTFYLAFRWNPTSNVREYEMVIRYKGPR